MNFRKNENLCLLFILTSELNCDKENQDFNKYTCTFHKRMLSNLTCVLICSL